MTVMSHDEITRRLLDPGVIAIIRADDAGQLLHAARAMADGGVVAMEVTMTTPDALDVIRNVTRELAGRWAKHGLQLAFVCPATEAETVASHSTWARRLGVGRTRPAWRVSLRRAETGAANDDLECAG